MIANAKYKVRYLLFAIVAALSVLAFLLQGCSRSEKFKKDQAYYNQTYYGPDGTGSSRVAAMGQPKKRIIIFDFWNDTPIQDRTMGQFAGDELRRELFFTKRLILPTHIRTNLKTEDFLEDDRVRVAQLIREGRRMGVSVLVIGKIAKVVFRQRGDDVGLLRQVQSMGAVDVEIKLFDVQNGREIAAFGHSGEASSNSMVALEGKDLQSKKFRLELAKMATRKAVKKLVPEVIRSIEKMSWQGRVAKIEGSKVYINSGRKSGLVVGDILRVLTKGNDVYDPESGAYLGRTPGQMKGTLEIVEYLGDDAAISKPHTGGQFQEGDIIRLY